MTGRERDDVIRAWAASQCVAASRLEHASPLDPDPLTWLERMEAEYGRSADRSDQWVSSARRRQTHRARS